MLHSSFGRHHFVESDHAIDVYLLVLVRLPHGDDARTLGDVLFQPRLVPFSGFEIIKIQKTFFSVMTSTF